METIIQRIKTLYEEVDKDYNHGYTLLESMYENNDLQESRTDYSTLVSYAMDAVRMLDNIRFIIGVIAGMIIVGGLLLCAIGEVKAGVSTAIIGVILLLFAYLIDTKQITKPAALDVYRGKTTLEITYRDSVAIDSTVVYKMK